MYDCLNNIIGITQSTCPCVIDGMTNDDLTEEWYKESTSGLYIDKLEGIIQIQSVRDNTDCLNEMAQWYYDARASAIKVLGDELIAGLTSKYRQRNKTYTGKIASTSFTGNLSISDTYTGIKLSTAGIVGGYLTISTITTMMNATATFDIYIYKVDKDADEYELVETIPDILSIANSKKENTLTDPITLDFTEYGTDYFIVYQPSGFQPKANGIGCGCSGNGNLLKAFLSTRGVSGSSLTTLNSWSTSSYANGLSLYAEVGCDEKALVCEMYKIERFKTVMAYAIRYKTGELVHEYIRGSQQINRYTMANSEYILGKRNHFRVEYNNRVQWLVQNADANLTGCFICNQRPIRKTGILV